MNLAVIPARGGSKRIPQKNIRSFCGRPVMAYSIQAAISSGVFERIVVSTDCPKTAELAESCGAEVPFVRPAELADDLTPTIPVIAHALEFFSAADVTFDHVCCIYASAPFVLAADLVAGLQKMVANPQADFLIPITTFAFPIFRALKSEQGNIKMFWPEHEQTRSQDLPEAYHDAGQFYWGRSKAWTGQTGLYSANTIAMSIPRHRVQDLDTLEDWERAEKMYQLNEASRV